ncbi:RHS repeat-associated core domain-containing protein [Hymenobacter rigui]|uniref:RHS repeat-associated core domain-containing protein n=1 Tax=Hymenobacter rigui TaxID=334424 RepID=A0A3R9MJ95_9BACT|nr:RHS repeat-associated core domain-containing protein [Hymenobacter rigui]RSK47173.1 RHS repeat-associated core domain-containing protein [Hymenobacter rigui]
MSVSTPIRQTVGQQFAHSGDGVALLNAGGTSPRPLGPVKQLTVARGDTVDVTAFGMYQQPVQQSNWGFSLASFVASLLQQQPAAPFMDGGKRVRVLPLLNVGLGLVPVVQQLSGGVPKSYLRVLVYNADSALVDSRTQQLTSIAQGGYEQLSLRVFVPQAGYVQTYVANESDTDVFFDDITVEHRQGLQVQENQYDPYGLDLAGLSHSSIPGNKYTFNGKEQQSDFGFNWQDFGFRMYDYTIGRWNTTDPLSGMRNWVQPYNFVQNNPLNRLDPNGLTDFTLDKKTGDVKQVGTSNDDPDRILRTDKNGIKYKKNGEARVAIGNIEKGILENGQNFRNNDNLIKVNGNNQPSSKGVESFALKLSNYLGIEIAGIYMSKTDNGNISHIAIGYYGGNTLTSAKSHGNTLAYSENLTVTGFFHTHPSMNVRLSDRVVPSDNDLTSMNNYNTVIKNENIISVSGTCIKYSHNLQYFFITSPEIYDPSQDFMKINYTTGYSSRLD